MNQTHAPLKKRNLVGMFFLTLFTGCLYYLYWTYKTKEEINRLGGNIPTFLFALLPFFNIYFHYCYAREFVKYIMQQDDKALVIAYFLLLLLLPVISMFAIQYALNTYQEKQA